MSGWKQVPSATQTQPEISRKENIKSVTRNFLPDLCPANEWTLLSSGTAKKLKRQGSDLFVYQPFFEQ